MSEEEKIEESPDDGKTERPEEELRETILPPQAIDQTEKSDIITSDI